MSPLFKQQQFFSHAEQQQLIEAIQQAETTTTGEIRVFVENRCRYVDALLRAEELFYQLKMNTTQQRNAVLIYIALKDRQLAIFADEGIYKKVDKDFWLNEIKLMLNDFYQKNFIAGLSKVIKEVGALLSTYFPASGENKNELPNDLLFGA
jgi:uncharacterized membrane protein